MSSISERNILECSVSTEKEHTLADRGVLYHGSTVEDLPILEPRSRLHGADSKHVLYLTTSIPYALVYIWDHEKTQYSKKWVTCWLQEGVVYYEEQFPGQLKAFYEGVRGALYHVERTVEVCAMANREGMYYSGQSMPVSDVRHINDVYQELLRYERQGLFRLLRFEQRPREKQDELIRRIAMYIQQEHLQNADTEEARFMKRYFTRAWEALQKNAFSCKI